MDKFEVKDLDLYYGEFQALKKLSLQIPAREITCLLYTSRLCWLPIPLFPYDAGFFENQVDGPGRSGAICADLHSVVPGQSE